MDFLPSKLADTNGVAKPPRPKKNQKIQRRPAMRRVNVAAKSVGSGNNDPSSGAEQKQIRCDGAKAVGSWKKGDGNHAEGQAQNQADFLTFVIDQRANADGGQDQAHGLAKRDGAILFWGQMKPGREIGQDSAEHRRGHAIDKDRQDGGKNKHRQSGITDAKWARRQGAVE